MQLSQNQRTSILGLTQSTQRKIVCVRLCVTDSPRQLSLLPLLTQSTQTIIVKVYGDIDIGVFESLTLARVHALYRVSK